MNIKDTLIISFYRFVFAPVALTVLVFLVAPFNKKVRTYLKLKFRPNSKFSKHSLWFHSASGEFEYCKPLILKINQTMPEEKIFATFSSHSYKSRIENFKAIDGSSPLPIDLPGPVGQFLNHLQPKILLIAKTDLWPELIYQCWQRKVPIVVFAAVTKPPGFLFTFTGFIKRWMYNKCDLIICMTDSDAQNLKDMGVETSVQVCGDPRIDQILNRVKHPNYSPSELLKTSTPTLTIGSSWPQDEKVVLPAIFPLIKNNSLQVIIAPHEPSEAHFKAIQKLSLSKGVTTLKLSELTLWPPGHLLYVDSVGALADLYALSQISFIGGSFKSQVHSVAEAIGHGNFVLIGPKNHNNREAQIFKSKKVNSFSIVAEVTSSDRLSTTLNSLLNDRQLLFKSKPQIQAEIKNLAEGTERTLGALERFIF